MKRMGTRFILAALAVILIAFVAIRIVRSGKDGVQRRQNVPRVVVESARREPIARALEFTGDVAPLQQAGVFAKVTGTLERVSANIGDRVTAGQLLARIDTTELAQTARQTAAMYDNAKTNFTRIRELADQNLLSKQDLDNADAALKVARANNENAQTRLGYAAVTAPFSGYITKRALDPGAVVTANNATLFTLMDLDVVKVLVNVLEKDIPLVVKGMHATVTVDAYPGRTFDGTVTRFSEALDLGTRTMPVEIDIPNRDHVLKGGMFASVSIVAERHDDAVTVPTQALGKDNAGLFVFVVEDGKARRVRVTTGMESNNRTEILSGLVAGQTVITAGQAMLRDGAAVQLPR